MAMALIAPASWLVTFPIAPQFAWLISLVVTFALTALTLLLVPKIGVSSGILSAGRIRVPTKNLGSATVFSGEEKRIEMGINLDARAQLCTSPWIDCIVKIEVLDEADPVPYLVISTRRPEKLLKAIKESGS